MLGYPDSNQEKQDQNLLCYHYTISQFCCLYQDALPIKTLQRYGFFANYQTFSELFFEIFFAPCLAYLILYLS